MDADSLQANMEAGGNQNREANLQQENNQNFVLDDDLINQGAFLEYVHNNTVDDPVEIQEDDEANEVDDEDAWINELEAQQFMTGDPDDEDIPFFAIALNETVDKLIEGRGM